VRTAAPAPDVRVRDLLAAWRTLGRRSRALLLLQTSASMRTGVPGTGKSRLALATAAADAVVRTRSPDADLGLWTFFSEPDGRAGHSVQVPVGPLFDRVGDRSRRDALLGELSAVSARSGTGSGINATVLDGFRAMERGFVYGRLNTVLVFTDGTPDAGGTSQATLLRRLREEFDGVAPVRVITVAYGATDGSRLIQVSDVTGGRSFSAVTPEQVPDLMREALSEL
jgi:Ca-activated chloride channel family protein